MSKRVRCISRKVNGMLHCALPHLFLDPFEDGEERDLDDEVAEKVLNSVCFEEVQPQAKFVNPLRSADKADAQPDGGNL